MYVEAEKLAELNDARLIPALIAIIEAHNHPTTNFYIGSYALRPLTGVEFDAAHDGGWWRQWWENNNQRFPQNVRELKIPVLQPAEPAR